MTDPADTALTAVTELRAQRDAAQGDLADTVAEQAADQRDHDATVAGLKATIADLRAQLDPWQVLHTYDLTRDEGWKHTTGVRANVDASYNRKAQTTFSPGGMTITAERDSTGRVVSSDTSAKFVPLPVHFALEADVTLSGWLGKGCFPAPGWFKTIEGGGGELDGLEYMGNRSDSTNPKDRALTWKTTAIGLPATTPLKQIEKPAEVPDPTTLRLRWEKTDGKFVTILAGKVVASITRTEFDTKWGAGQWDKNFEDSAKHWYYRATYQFGPPADGKSYNAAGPVPADWAKSTMTLTRVVAYAPRTA